MIYLICTCGSGVAIRANGRVSASHLKDFRTEHPDAVEVSQEEYDETFAWGKEIFD
jgi:hypothetical protein